MTNEEIKKCFANRELDKEATEYLTFHSLRYANLLTMVKELKKNSNLNSFKILDVGPSFFTELLLKTFPADKISILGFGQADEFRGGHLPQAVNLTGHYNYFEFDLNNSTPDKNLLGQPKFNLMIIAEVIEHLPTSIKLVLGFLKNLLEKDGLIIIQTPNALSIDKRIAILRGINPYEMIRESKTNPGHFREYALYELLETLKELGLKLVEHSFFNYPPPQPQGIKGRMLDLFYKLAKHFKPELRDGITLIAKI